MGWIGRDGRAGRLLPERWRAGIAARDRPRWLDWLPRGLRRDGLVVVQHVRDGRFQRGLALMTAASALLGGAEVAYEHYRGSYGQRKMYSPVALTPPLVLSALWCVFDRRAARRVLPLVSLATVGDGLLGFAYHVRGVARKPGGWRIPIFNVVMGPPLFAPLLFALPGHLGLIASLLRREEDPARRGLFSFASRRPAWLGLLPTPISRRARSFRNEVREGRFQRHLAGAAAVSSLLSGLEALYSHYKTAFRYKVQWSPVVVSPLLAAAGLGAIFSRRAARTVLPAFSALAVANGALGFFHHARGVARRPGGLRMPLYNAMYGPPLFAPLLFAGAGSLGLLASLLRRER